ncbi:hypothetical protein THRCLA_21821 [Thraustotheca clavata]|uniref:Uncharacterized protein n=1 Tax=Thraustotheca clavata TaxID=74557 RepID=A0A1V9ZNF6_9STRA|nr:hypothetical protein THRCLA_21821 [Thraustotheca clavata]
MEGLMATFQWEQLFKAMAKHVYLELKRSMGESDEWIGRVAACGTSGAFAAWLVAYRRKHARPQLPNT